MKATQLGFQHNGCRPVCLIIPPSSFLIDDRVFPLLGVLKVAAALRAGGLDAANTANPRWVEVWDLSGEKDYIRALELKTIGLPDLAWPMFGITATMPQMPATVKIAEHLREYYPASRLILGGPHVTLMNASAKREEQSGRRERRARRYMDELREMFDVLVAGDGEKAVFEAIGEAPRDLIDCDDTASAYYMQPEDLNAAPFPARDLIDIHSYRYQIEGLPTQSLIAQLGCPFGCNFCGGRRSPFLRKVRSRTTAHVLTEIGHLYETYGTRGFMFLDDELNVNKEFETFLRGLIRMQKELRTTFRLRGLVKSELLTQQLADLIYEAGFRQLLIGFESGHDRILLNMNKHATVADNTRCVEICKRADIKVKALMSLGHPGESRETIAATRDWLLEVQPHDFDVTIITVYPGTPYFDDSQPAHDGDWRTYRAKNGDHLHYLDVDQTREVNFYKGAPGAYQSFVWTDYLYRTEMTELRDAVEREVRETLSIPWPSTPAEIQYEHSMGCR